MNSSRTVAAMVLVLAMASSVAQAQARIPFAEYSAQFLCGVVKEEGAAPVRPGWYDTSINIHNPQLVPSAIFFKKLVLAPREGEKPLPPSRFRRDVLKPDFAEHVDCKIIRSMLGNQGGTPFVEGFVVLIAVPEKETTASELDVVGV